MRLNKHEWMAIEGGGSFFAQEGEEVASGMAALARVAKQLRESGDVQCLYHCMEFARHMKRVAKTVNTFRHELACLAAKAWLEKHYGDVDWAQVDVLKQKVNAKGPDILVEAARIVAMVKTIEPTTGNGFRARVKSDVEKLSSAAFNTYARYMFVTSPRAFCFIDEEYQRRYPLVTFVLLRNENQYDVFAISK